ncbi:MULTISPECIES: cysteine hydrolase family protein [unclassified Clostridium]|jgi:amidase|uniref:cysteine hydrolase family protein n=1 Tax=unclassified Clostridium TaxID=2614128 RepID=UPI0025C0101D|nr:isochorismatase family protein [Clostridium sp.]MDY2632939.1 isochorismatase family protein [Clostridium sp.]MDY4253561.1 isochorismatase family protein [Clostridium sp.]MDY6229069.1 isochorismatase family protein [Clostridium sp.]
MKKLLVVIDYQKDFVDGALGFEEAVTLEEGIYNKVNENLKEGNKVLFTYDTHEINYLETREGKNLPVVHCIKGTEGHKLFGKLQKFEHNKNVISYEKYGFGLAPEDMIKISKEIGEDLEEIEIVGVVTNICVISNFVMFQSQYRNADIVVDASLCASFDESLHSKTLDIIEGLQGKVINK